MGKNVFKKQRYILRNKPGMERRRLQKLQIAAFYFPQIPRSK